MTTTMPAILDVPRSGARARREQSKRNPYAVRALAALRITLPQNGLDRMTQHRIESQLCTSALTAHL